MKALAIAGPRACHPMPEGASAAVTEDAGGGPKADMLRLYPPHTRAVNDKDNTHSLIAFKGVSRVS